MLKQQPTPIILVPTQNSRLLYVLNPQDKILELQVLYVPKSNSLTGGMQLSLTQLEHCLKIPFIAGHRLSEEEYSTIQQIVDHAKQHNTLANADTFSLIGKSGPDLLKKLIVLNSTRVVTAQGFEIPCFNQTVQELKLQWVITSDGLAKLTPITDKNICVFSSLPITGLDKKTNTFYELACEVPAIEVAAALMWPAFGYAECAGIASQIRTSWSANMPQPPFNTPLVLDEYPLEPYLFICKQDEDIFTQTAQTYLSVAFGYGPYLFEGKDAGTTVNSNGQWASVKRKPNAEVLAAHELTKFGFFEQPYKKNLSKELRYYPTKAVDWDYFLTKGVSYLRKLGWHVQIDDDVAEKFDEITNVIVEHKEVSNDWFELDLGFEINGKKFDLAEVLGTVFKKDSRWLNKQAVETIDDEEIIPVKITGENFKAIIKAKILKPIALNIIDFFDSPRNSINKKDIARFAIALSPFVKNNSFFNKSKQDLIGFDNIVPCEIPTEITAKLRPYQEYGVAWLQHMLKYGFGAILADDRGLGKTLQSITHLAIEHFKHKKTKPSLIVVEASLWEKWSREFAKFCPNLPVKVLYGKSLKTTPIEDSTVYITTFTSLKQHLALFEAVSWHVLIMDEAQNAKNYKTANAQALNSLNCTQKICVTGTPIENNLSELWSLFNLAIPGFLGSLKDFTRIWRKPIEQENNTVKQKILARRCSSFILLRKKKDVAPEIPDKIDGLQGEGLIELGTDQRNLYDAIHVSMTEKVMEQIEKIGLKKSNILILDALLKLRQICCDPSLMGKPVSSAKRKKALDIIKNLIAENKKVILFSQFRSMLNILEQDLIQAGIRYTMLTGLTKARQEKVDLFEQGHVDVFLITLKAGGKGLDLLNADAVILYDPWWNPAAEDQAVDRAHRIGQSKEIAVYKLICKNTVEEKIIALQAKKANIANGVLDEALDGTSNKITTQDLLDLLI